MERIFGFEGSLFAPALGVGLFMLVACGDSAGGPPLVIPAQSGATSTPTPTLAGAPAVAGVTGATGGAANSQSAGAPAIVPVPQATAGSQTNTAGTTALAGAAAVGAGSAGMAAALPAEPPPAATLTIKAPQIAPGAEDTQCVQVRLPTTAPLNVIKLHNRLSDGSHHFILTALNDPSAPETPLARCQGFGGSVAGAPLAITQAHDDYVYLPEGVGYRLNAGQVMHLEMHYINTTERTLDISATTDLFAAAPGAQIQEGAVLLVGTADFKIPAHSTKETAPKFLALPAGMEDVKFYAITGHTHRFGTKVGVSLASDTMTLIMPLYAPEHFDWESPQTKQLMPHVSVPKGGGFMLQCAWNNTGDSELGWGESANAEMCFFWGYYYPRKDVFSIVVDNIDQETLKNIAGLPPAP